MEIKDLNDDESVALVSLFQHVVAGDHSFGGGEGAEIAKLANAMGQDRYRRCLDESDSRVSDAEELKELLLTVERQDARDLIYDLVMRLTFEDGIEPSENAILDWLSSHWNVQESPAGPDRGIGQ